MSLQRRRDYLKSTIFLSAVVLTSFLHFREEATKKVTRNTTKTRRKVLLFKLINLSLSPFDELKGAKKNSWARNQPNWIVGRGGKNELFCFHLDGGLVRLAGHDSKQSWELVFAGWSSSRNENLRS